MRYLRLDSNTDVKERIKDAHFAIVLDWLELKKSGYKTKEETSLQRSGQRRGAIALKSDEEIKKANLQYESIKNETDLIAFVLENEHLDKDLPLIWDYEYNQEGNYYEYLQIDNPINFCGQELIDFFKFLWNYNTQHSLLLEKYGSLSPEEQSDIYNNHDYDHYDISSLQLQLQIRKSFEALGFELPLFISNNREP